MNTSILKVPMMVWLIAKENLLFKVMSSKHTLKLLFFFVTSFPCLTSAVVNSVEGDRSVVLGEEITFTIMGNDLADNMVFWLEDCQGEDNTGYLSEEPNGTENERRFTCERVQSTGTKQGVLKDRPGGNELYKVNVTVTAGLEFPIDTGNPYTRRMTVILDHNRARDIMVSYAGERGLPPRQPAGQNPNLHGYRGYLHDDVGYPIMHVANPNSYDDISTVLFYEAGASYSHPGYDYGRDNIWPDTGRDNAGSGTIVASRGGQLYIVRNDSTEDSRTDLGTAWCIFHVFKIDHDNGLSTWYLHAGDFVDEDEDENGNTLLDHVKNAMVDALGLTDEEIAARGGRIVLGNNLYHCQSPLPNVNNILVGEVNTGQRIAAVSSTGAGNARHLHFVVRDEDAVGHLIDPYGWEGVEDQDDPLASNWQDLLWANYIQPVIEVTERDGDNGITKRFANLYAYPWGNRFLVGGFNFIQNEQEPILQVWRTTDPENERKDGTHVGNVQNTVAVRNFNGTESILATNINPVHHFRNNDVNLDVNLDVVNAHDLYTVKVGMPVGVGPRSKASIINTCSVMGRDDILQNSIEEQSSVKMPISGNFLEENEDGVVTFNFALQNLSFELKGYKVVFGTQPNVPNLSANDIPLVGDWNGDNIDEVGFFRPTSGDQGGGFYLERTRVENVDDAHKFEVNAYYYVSVGAYLPHYIPVVGNLDNDNRDEIGGYDPTTNTFHLYDVTLGNNPSLTLVERVTLPETPEIQPCDYPIVGDWDDDGEDDVGVFRLNSDDPNTLQENEASKEFQFYVLSNGELNHHGSTEIFDRDNVETTRGNFPVIGDWDGDGHDDIGIYAPLAKTVFYGIYTSPNNFDLNRQVCNFQDLRLEDVDSQEQAWYVRFVNKLCREGNIKGNRSHFRPSSDITKAEFLKLAIYANCNNTTDESCNDDSDFPDAITPFTDVPSTHWASGLIAYAADEGVISTEHSEFHPDVPIQRGEMAKLIVKVYGSHLGYDWITDDMDFDHLTDAQKQAILDRLGENREFQFEDVDSEIEWWYYYVHAIGSTNPNDEARIFEGFDGRNFKPSKPGARTGAAKVICMATYSDADCNDPDN